VVKKDMGVLHDATTQAKEATGKQADAVEGWANAGFTK
jgi:hypothetical protein